MEIFNVGWRGVGTQLLLVKKCKLCRYSRSGEAQLILVKTASCIDIQPGGGGGEALHKPV